MSQLEQTTLNNLLKEVANILSPDTENEEPRRHFAQGRPI
jgi:hypothetical protein